MKVNVFVSPDRSSAGPRVNGAIEPSAPHQFWYAESVTLMLSDCDALEQLFSVADSFMTALVLPAMLSESDGVGKVMLAQGPDTRTGPGVAAGPDDFAWAAVTGMIARGTQAMRTATVRRMMCSRCVRSETSVDYQPDTACREVLVDLGRKTLDVHSQI